MSRMFPNLFSPFELGPLALKNRLFVPGHGTCLSEESHVGDDLIAYHERRAAAGVGLIIVEVNMIHASAVYSPKFLSAADDGCIPGLTRLAEAVRSHDCGIFGQLYHPGRSLRSSLDGSLLVAHAPSEVPDEVFHVSPRPFPIKLIREVVESYGLAAARMMAAGLDGVEIVASHGYLVSQFLNPRINLRDDEFGGDFERRLRFAREVIRSCREAVGAGKVVGMRISGDEMDHEGLRPEEVRAVCAALDRDGVLDYFNVIAGSVHSTAGLVHVVPPMAVETAYVAPLAAAIKAEVRRPVLVAGRINDPQTAERVLAAGQADMCGLVRAHIADPEFARKAAEDRPDDIRACIGCDQACIGHMMEYKPISCIQHPETGRERRFATKPPAAKPRRVWVVGGGPGGMKAAAVAAERGHRVTLYEKSARLGGQALLAQALPGRMEFGGIVTNLAREVAAQNVEVVRNTEVSAAMVREGAPDAVVLATGGEPYLPSIEMEEGAHVVDAWAVIRDEANVGASVVIADWRCDWVGMGVAEKLARAGCHVRIAVNGLSPGDSLVMMVRDQWLGTLHKLGVEIVPNVRLAGADGDSTYFIHRASGEPVICEGVDTLVLAQGQKRVAALEDALEDWGGEVIPIGDCLAPRTCEEAIFEGLKAGMAL